ncbi:hypothetical protein R4K55_05050 [Brachyspira alvinipulli]|uniref:hypothetical protein n=1 Tax=Brachyspira alvinipulli TaxID=84379 RepID=UPI0030061FC2
MKKILLLILLISIIVSCSKSPMNPTVSNSKYTFVASDEMMAKDWNDQAKKDYFYTNFKYTFASKIVYKDESLSSINGKTDESCNYYDDGKSEIKAKFKYATNVYNRGKNYIGGLYYSPSSWTGYKWYIIYINENGAEICVNAKKEVSDDETSFPDKNTEWWDTPSAVYGYIKLD